MEKTKKYYAKAMDYYCNGYIEKALEYCEKSLFISRNYSPALNLKGLIQYVKGNLEEAQLTWRINYKLNNDGISKKYLEDSKKDKDILELFNQGLSYYKEIRIHKALEIFEECEKSHFNVLKLWNYIALCYMKLGEYDKCNYYINEVLKIDKTNELAINTKNTLVNLGITKKEVNLRKMWFIPLIGLLLIVSILVYYNKDMIKSVNVLDKFTKFKTALKNKDKSSNESLPQVIEDYTENKEETVQQKDIENSLNSKKTMPFDFEAVKQDLDNNNYEKLLSYLETYNIEELSINEKALLIKVQEKIKASGINYFYDMAMSYRKNNDFKQSLLTLNRIYKYSEESYLNEHITYMIGFCYEKLYDIENATKYYEIYASKFIKGDYIEPCLYSLALMNKDVDKEKSKKYAKMLSSEYPKSQYNNSVIKSIIKE